MPNARPYFPRLNLAPNAAIPLALLSSCSDLRACFQSCLLNSMGIEAVNSRLASNLASLLFAAP